MSTGTDGAAAPDAGNSRVAGSGRPSPRAGDGEGLYDRATGLHSRAWIMDMLGISLRAGPRGGLGVGVVVMDFEAADEAAPATPDPCGEQAVRTRAGPDLAAALASRVTAVLRAGTYIGRSEPGQLLVVVPGVSGAHRVRPLVQRMLAAATTPLPRIAAAPTVHLGVTIPRDATAPGEVYEDACRAAREARAKGVSWQFHAPSLPTSTDPEPSRPRWS